MRFVVDANLSPKVARYLQAAGHDAVHVVDVDLQHASDLVIMNWARTDERVVLSSDTDFGTLLARFEAAIRPSCCYVTSTTASRTSRLRLCWPTSMLSRTTLPPARW